MIAPHPGDHQRRQPPAPPLQRRAVGNIVISGARFSRPGSSPPSPRRGIAVGPTGSGSGTAEIDVAAGQSLTYGGIIAKNGTGTDTLIFGSG